jgi:hypothetical protein
MLKDQYGYPVPVYGLGDTTTLSLGLTQQRITLIPLRWYRIWSSVDCFIKQGDGSVAATANDCPITAKADIVIMTADAKHCISGIVSSGSGVLYATEAFI